MSFDDKLAIYELNIRYALHIDRGETDLWVETFSPDGVFDGRAFGFGMQVGHEEIRAYGRRITANTVQLAHIMTNHLVTVLTPTTAKGTAYCTAEGMSRTKEHTRFHVFYEDDYIKIDGEWKISRRVNHMKFPPETLSPAD